MTKKEILRVRADVKRIYAKLSKIYANSIYAALEGMFEKELREKSLELLAVQEGEIVLEVGFGTGYTLVQTAKCVGDSGRVYGIDVTPEMVRLTKERVEKHGLVERVELSEADARDVPYKSHVFDSVYMAITLELFDTPDIPRVLAEIKRVLKPTGRLVIVSIPKEGYEDSRILKFYEWIHRAFPKYSSCRPIYVEDSIAAAGYRIIRTREVKIARLFPMKIIVAKA